MTGPRSHTHHVISDVDSHSQCAMLVRTEGEKVVEISGDPDDLECRGEISCSAVVSDEIKPYVVHLQFGFEPLFPIVQ